MIFQRKLDKKEYYKELLSLLTFFKFSEFELDILTTMLCNNMTEVNIDTREYIRKILNKDKYITNNYVKRLRLKGVLLDRTDLNRVYYINPTIMEIIKEGKLTFEFSINDDN